LTDAKATKKGYVAPLLKSSLQILYGRYHEMVDRYEISISQMTMRLFHVFLYYLDNTFTGLFE